MTRVTAILFLSLLASLGQPMPPMPAAPAVRASAPRKMLAPRQATATGQSVSVPDKTDVVVASRIAGGVQSNWWAKMWTTNLAALRVVNVTNIPPAPAVSITVEWREACTVLFSDDLLNWTNLSVTTTRSFTVPAAAAGFFRVPKSAIDARLTWKPSPSEQVAGYRVYSGPYVGAWTSSVDVGLQTSWLAAGLVPGQVIYFAAAAYNAANEQSELSNIVRYDVPNADPVVNIFTR